MNLKYEPASESLHISENMQKRSVSFSSVQFLFWKHTPERDSLHRETSVIARSWLIICQEMRVGPA